MLNRMADADVATSTEMEDPDLDSLFHVSAVNSLRSSPSYLAKISPDRRPSIKRVPPVLLLSLPPVAEAVELPSWHRSVLPLLQSLQSPGKFFIMFCKNVHIFHAVLLWICFRSRKNGAAAVAATKASFLGGRKLRQGKRAARAQTARRELSVSAAAAPERPLWFPGSTPPPWLDGSLPGDFGFDPLGLGSDPESLRWNQQAEIVHCRWAMLGAAGIFIPELLTKIGILNTPSWYTAGQLQYFTDTTTLFVIELILIGWAEGRRWADIIKPGCVNTDPIFPNNKLTGTDVGYPGGFWFDPLGWGSGSPEKVKELRTKEIKNGRLAMLAVMGAWFQAIYTGTGPIDNLFAHLADPGHATVFSAFTPN
ncbi:unnamed protein product [Musa hybrid cultivar]